MSIRTYKDKYPVTSIIDLHYNTKFFIERKISRKFYRYNFKSQFTNCVSCTERSKILRLTVI